LTPLVFTYLQFQTEICFLMPVSFLADCCVLWLNDTSCSKSV